MAKRAFKLGVVVGVSISAAAHISVCAAQASTTPPGSVSTADSNDLSEIVVSARRVEERLEDVPISITVFSQESLTDKNVNFASDLATYTPSLSADTEFGGNSTSFSIRGFAQAIQTAPTVGVYFDDAVAPRGGPFVRSGDGAGPGSLFDLQNVQVLKGPQGTLFGRNTTGGAVLLVPQKPTGNYEGYVEASYGDYDMERTQAVANLPISDAVRLRVGFDHETRDGYLNNISSIGPSRFGNIDYTAGRVSLVVDLAPNLENYTIATISNSDDAGPIQQIFACNAKAAVFGSLACAQLARDKPYGLYAVDNSQPNAESWQRQWQVINTTTWTASDSLTVKNIAAYGQVQAALHTGIFGLNWIIPSSISVGAISLPTGALAGTPVSYTSVNANKITNQGTYSEEFRLQGNAFNTKLQWQTGIYFEGSNSLSPVGTNSISQGNCSNPFTLQCSDPLGEILHTTIAAMGAQYGTIDYHDSAIYEQATYALSDHFKLTEGLRYTYDVTTGAANRIDYTFPEPDTPVGRCFSIYSTLSSGCFQSYHQVSQAPTGLIDLDYTPTEDLLLYAKYARGYRQGGLQEQGPDGETTFGPEHVDAYEVGSKTSFHGSVPVTLNSAIFYNNFTDQQLPIYFLPASGSGASPAQGIINVGKSRIWGLELEGLVKPFNGFTLDVSYAYLDTRLLKVAPVVLAPGGVYSATIPLVEQGSTEPNTPRNKGSATASYRLPLDASIGPITVSATDSYISSQLITAGAVYPDIPAYNLVNLNVDWHDIYGKPFDLEFFMTNALNRFYATYVNDTEALGYAARQIGEPRMFGVRARVHFR